jgi:pimeloyl-ACP methyl ester carboxylesterase
MRLAEQDPDEALAWAASLGTEEEIAAAKGQIALVLAETDPQRAAHLLSESGIAGREFDVAVVQVLQRWAAQAPPEAAAWAASFPLGAAREAGLNIIVAQWAQADAQAAFAWMSGLQDETVRKEVALAMEEALLQQPQNVRDAWLQHADANTRSELEQQREQAMKEVGDNVPPPPSANGNAETHHDDAALPRQP